MKRTLLTLAMTIATFLGFQANINAQTTKTYTPDLTVTINDISTEPKAANVIVIFNEDGTMDLTLKNFILYIGEDGLPVGNIAVKNIKLQNSKYRSFKTFHRTETIQLEEGDPEISDLWLATDLNELGGVPIVMKGQINDEKLYVTIDIDMTATLAQNIYVKVGEPWTEEKPENCKEYTDNLTVSINDFTTEPQPATVLVFKNEDGTMDLTLTNFTLYVGEDGLPVGNIAVNNLTLTPSKYGTYNTFERTETIELEEGDPEISDMWLATDLNALGGVPIILKGQIDDDKLYVTIDIDMTATLTQVIYVKVGEPWEENIPLYTVNFVVDGETISTQELEGGSAITVPEVEAREGYTFEWLDEIPSTISDNLTINGQYVPNKYWVQFFVDGVAVYEMEQEYGTPITVPEVEEREGYTFAWEDEIPATVPAEPVLVLGFYTANTYTITFMLDGQEYARYDLEYGTAITAPDVTSDDRYTFSGWDEVPETMPAHDVIVSGGMVDGVSKIENGKKKAENAYTISGMRVNLKHARGIIIVDGKKILKRYN